MLPRDLPAEGADAGRPEHAGAVLYPGTNGRVVIEHPPHHRVGVVVVVAVEFEPVQHELAKLFLENRIHGVTVVDEVERLVGVVSQTDLLNWHYEMGVDGSTFYDDRGTPLGDSEGTSVQLTDIRTATISEVMSRRRWRSAMVMRNRPGNGEGSLSTLSLKNSRPIISDQTKVVE